MSLINSDTKWSKCHSLAASALVNHSQLGGIVFALFLAGKNAHEYSDVKINADREQRLDVTTVAASMSGYVLQ